MEKEKEMKDELILELTNNSFSRRFCCAIAEPEVQGLSSIILFSVPQLFFSKIFQQCNIIKETNQHSKITISNKIVYVKIGLCFKVIEKYSKDLESSKNKEKLVPTRNINEII